MRRCNAVTVDRHAIWIIRFPDHFFVGGVGRQHRCVKINAFAQITVIVCIIEFDLLHRLNDGHRPLAEHIRAAFKGGAHRYLPGQEAFEQAGLIDRCRAGDVSDRPDNLALLCGRLHLR